MSLVVVVEEVWGSRAKSSGQDRTYACRVPVVVFGISLRPVGAYKRIHIKLPFLGVLKTSKKWIFDFMMVVWPYYAWTALTGKKESLNLTHPEKERIFLKKLHLNQFQC